VQVLRRFDDREVELETLRPFMQKGFPWHNPERPNPPARGAEEWWDALLPVFEEAFLGCHVPPVTARMLAGKVRSVYTDIAEWNLFEDTRPVLEELQEAGWTHMILSNHVPELPALVAGLGLSGLIGSIVNSAHTGFEKPHPAAYQAALGAIEEPVEVWMIGDNIHADVLGAEAAGLPAILVRNQDPRARRRAQSLHDVKKFLGC